MAFITGNGASFSKQMPTAKIDQKMLLINWTYISKAATSESGISAAYGIDAIFNVYLVMKGHW